MAVANLKFIPEDEYLALEEQSDEKHEYHCGQIFAMAGGTPPHSQIASRALIELDKLALASGCVVYNSDLRIRVSATGLNTYSDVSVVCGELQVTDQRPPAATNPTIIVEVLSESTQAYDRGEKWRHYQTIESLTDYLIVWQDRPRVEHYVRQPGGMWGYQMLDGIDARLRIDTLGGDLAIAEVYRGVTFPDTPPLLRPRLKDEG